MRSAVAAALASLVLLAPPTADASHVATRTKTHAEVDTLRALPRLWKPSRLRGLVDRHTHLLANGTEAVCTGKGKRYTRGRYRRFVCAVRGPAQRSSRTLYVAYLARPHGRFTIRWLGFRAP